MNIVYCLNEKIMEVSESEIKEIEFNGNFDKNPMEGSKTKMTYVESETMGILEIY